MIRIVRTALVTGVITCGLAGCSKAEPLPPAIEQAMEARHQGFEEIGESFKKIGDTLKGGGDLNPELAAAAATIDARARQIVDWFPAGSGPDSGRKTEAKAEIWQQPDLFAEKRERLVAEAGTLAALASAGDAAGFAGQVKTVGAACKGCHDQFRAKD